jgi:hypothetical protein
MKLQVKIQVKTSCEQEADGALKGYVCALHEHMQQYV